MCPIQYRFQKQYTDAPLGDAIETYFLAFSFLIVRSALNKKKLKNLILIRNLLEKPY